MNKKIGMYSSICNVICVAVFAIMMLFENDFVSYLSSMFIAFSFAAMIGAFSSYTEPEKKAAANTAMIFAAIYVTIIILIYFAQLTVVHQGELTEQANSLLDYQNFGLFFNYNLLGYGMMALSTFFAGLSIEAETKVDKWLKRLLMIHGIFFITCLIAPLMGLFTTDMEGCKWIGIMVLEVWCIYFIPIGVLSAIHFLNKE